MLRCNMYDYTYTTEEIKRGLETNGKEEYI